LRNLCLACSAIILLSFLVQAPEGLAQSAPASGEQAAKYSALLQDIEKKRLEFAKNLAPGGVPSKEVVAKARDYLFQVLVDQVFPAWYGTVWEFYGKTLVPREGAIACGYFVTTTLQQVGLRIERVTLAKQPSETMIKNLVLPGAIKRFSNAPMARVARTIKAWGDGLYMVGLDQHTGFVVNRKGVLRFVHSSYYEDLMRVASQPFAETSPLSDSRYRVFGKLLGDPMILRWIRGETFPIAFEYRP
jgi:hypothetical protein